MSKSERRPSWGEIVEAAAGLAAAAMALRLLTFRRIVAMLPANRTDAGAKANEVERVRRAIDAWSRRLPVTPKCFARGLAAHWMLRRRKIASTLHYGAATIEGKLKAHVWVRSGELDVVGCDIAGDFALLASFPSVEEGGSPQKL